MALIRNGQLNPLQHPRPLRIIKAGTALAINDIVCPPRSALVVVDWTNDFKPMRKLLRKVKQSSAFRVLCRAYARWVEAHRNQGAAAFAYYLLLSFLPLVILLVAAGLLQASWRLCCDQVQEQ